MQTISLQTPRRRREGGLWGAGANSDLIPGRVGTCKTWSLENAIVQ